MIYSEVTTYSPMHDDDVTRLSAVVSAEELPPKNVSYAGAEYFCLIPRSVLTDTRGKRKVGWRDMRQSALDQMAEAIEAGAAPGEVTIKLDAKWPSSHSSKP